MATVTAGPARSSSFLPTVKCSNCNAKIEISLMKDHVCSVVSIPEFQFLPLNGSFSPFPSKSSNAPSIINVGSIHPSRADATTGARPPLLPTPQVIPKDISSSSRNVPPVARDGRRSPFQLPSWSASSSRRNAPPSDISITQASAFPPFPTPKSRSVTPTTPSATIQSVATSNGVYQAHSKSEYSFAPLSPRDNGGGSVLQRMNTIAPGPFHSNGQTELRQPGHKRTATMGSSKDFTHQPIVGVGKGDFQRPSTAGSTKSNGSIKSNAPSLSSISGGPRSTVKREGSQVPDIPTAPHLLRSQTTNTMSTEPMLESNQQTDTIDTLRQESRSNTFPLDTSEDRKRGEPGAVPIRKLSEPSSHFTKSSISIASTIRPLHEIGSISSFKPSRSVKGRAQSPVAADTSKESRSPSRDQVRNDSRPDPPFVSVSTQLPEYNIGNPYHTPTESIASTDSSGSDARSGSSTSTPPLFDSPQKQIPTDTSWNHDRGPDSSLTAESPTASGGARRVIPPSFSRPTYARPADKPALEQGILPPRLTVDPAIQSGCPSPEKPPDKGFDPFPVQSGNLPSLSLPKAPSSARRPKPASKGKCRGCQELIHGKSVSSADGRLTGRYHKQCFVCTTCKEPFRTADFYILDNQPYCGQHYHILNKSLCKSCDRGIEGQYLETESKQKFHPNCFTCQNCREILHDEYFEMNGKTFCERHAFGTFQQTSLLGPGRRHPERRTTRLMMM